MKFSRFALFLLMVVLGLSACVVASDEYEDARRQRDEYLAKLQELRLANDLLNQNIAAAYAECQAAASQVALSAAAEFQKILVLEGGVLQRPRSRSRPTGAERF